MKSGGDTKMVKTECPVGTGKLGDQCYIREEDYSAFTGGPVEGAPACPETSGEEACKQLLSTPAKGNQAAASEKNGRECEIEIFNLFSSNDIYVGEEPKCARYHALEAKISQLEEIRTKGQKDRRRFCQPHVKLFSKPPKKNSRVESGFDRAERMRKSRECEEGGMDALWKDEIGRARSEASAILKQMRKKR